MPQLIKAEERYCGEAIVKERCLIFISSDACNEDRFQFFARHSSLKSDVNRVHLCMVFKKLIKLTAISWQKYIEKIKRFTRFFLVYVLNLALKYLYRNPIYRKPLNHPVIEVINP